MGVSTKLYEYQAVGKPIICCAEGQPAEYVKETGSGVVVKPGDYEALAKAVLYLKEDRDAAGKLGVSGRLYVENSLSIEKIGSKMMTVFKKILASSSQIGKV
jgi:glycosyltransferase involved in cell wall biosynthesis